MRPEAARAGFPSGHTALAAAFYLMAAYITTQDQHQRWARRLTYGAASTVVLAVGLSRIVLWHHWPLDVVGGVALGVMVWAAAACWHERFPVATRPERQGVAVVREWVHRAQLLIPIPFFVLVLLTPPLELMDSRLHLIFDIVGSAFVVVGLWLRVWAAGHSRGGNSPGGLELSRTGPYAYMRHPQPLAHLLIGLGFVVFTESAPGLVLISALLVALYRVAVAVGDEALARRFGVAYAEHCARVPSLPRPTAELLRAAASMPWHDVLRTELRFIAVTLLLAGLADASEFLPRRW